MRERLWYLSMLFVLPEVQGAGVGRDLLSRVWAADGQDGAGGPEGPAAIVRATATDSAQPISNALYALHDIVPRMPLFSLTGLPQRPEAFGPLPSGIVPLAFDDIAAGPPDGQGHRLLVDAIDTLDRELLGVAHPVDHRFLRAESRHGWLYRGPDGSPVGYGYAGEAGRLGPVAARDEALLGPILGHLTAAVTPRGAFALWVGGAADRAIVPALRAGLRLDPFPVLRLLGPAVRGLRAVSADLARTALRRTESTADGPVRPGTTVPFAGPPRRVVASHPMWLQLVVPAAESVRS